MRDQRAILKKRRRLFGLVVPAVMLLMAVQAAGGQEESSGESAGKRTLLVENGEPETLVYTVLPAAGIMVDGRLDGDVLMDIYELNAGSLSVVPPGDWRTCRDGTEAVVVVGQYPPEEGKDSSPLAISWLPASREKKALSLSREDIPSVKIRAPWPKDLPKPAARAGGDLSEWKDLPVWYEINPPAIPALAFTKREGRFERLPLEEGEQRPEGLVPRKIRGAWEGKTLPLLLEGFSGEELWLVPFRDRDGVSPAGGVLQAAKEEGETGRLHWWQAAEAEAGKEAGTDSWLAGRWARSAGDGWEIDIFLDSLPPSQREAWMAGDISLDLYSRSEGGDAYWYITSLQLRDLRGLLQFKDVIGGGA